MRNETAADRPEGSAMRQDDSDEQATTSRRRVLAAQNVSRMCLVCGPENAFGLHGRFYELAPEGDEIEEPGQSRASGRRELLGVFTTREEHQSYPGRLHGGIAAAALDETIGRAIVIAHHETWGVTVELTVRYRQPLPLDRELRVLGRITRDGSRIFEGSGEILLDDGTVAVEARGKYLKMRLKDIAPAGMDEREWHADERRYPDWIDV
jgi:acyl-coenzyme A thioesterase PaaI-like protein